MLAAALVSAAGNQDPEVCSKRGAALTLEGANCLRWEEQHTGPAAEQMALHPALLRSPLPGRFSELPDFSACILPSIMA